MNEMSNPVWLCAANVVIDLKKIDIISIEPIGEYAPIQGEIYFLVQGNAIRATPYSLEKLGESVRNGEFHAADKGTFRNFPCAAVNTDSHDANACFPAFVYLVCDSNGNVKFCDAASLSFSIANEVAAIGARPQPRINLSAFHSALSIRNAIHNPDKNIGNEIFNFQNKPEISESQNLGNKISKQ